MKVFLDTNIVVDHLAQREPFAADASLLFTLIANGDLEASMSVLTVINAAYILRKHYNKQDVLQVIRRLMDVVEITPISRATLMAAYTDSPYDFEDAVQYESALAANPDYILTRDRRGFTQFRDIPSMPISDFIQHCLQP